MKATKARAKGRQTREMIIAAARSRNREIDRQRLETSDLDGRCHLSLLGITEILDARISLLELEIERRARKARP